MSFVAFGLLRTVKRSTHSVSPEAVGTPCANHKPNHETLAASSVLLGCEQAVVLCAQFGLRPQFRMISAIGELQNDHCRRFAFL